MTRTDDAPQLTDAPRGRRVASYRDARAAVLAVRALEDRGFDTDPVTIHPADLTVSNGAVAPRSSPDRAARPVGVTAGLVAFAAVLVVRGLSTSSIAVAVVTAAVLGLLASGAAWWSVRMLGRRRDRAARVVRASRFDVVAGREADRAGHLLATWWDPAAPPAPPT